MTSFADRIRSRERMIGTIVTIPAPEVTELLSSTGLDWLFIDTEHAAIDLLAAQRLLIGASLPCMIRLADSGEAAVKRALDSGAAGIIVPNVTSVGQAEAVVRHAKYPPWGARGVGIGRAQGYGVFARDYLEVANQSTAVVIQCESVQAVERIDALAAVAGVDAVFIGPHDLAASMGRIGDVEHPEVHASIARVREACERAGRALGIFGASVEALAPYADQGFTLLLAGADTLVLAAGMREFAEALR